jgi:hypothetical protein
MAPLQTAATRKLPCETPLLLSNSNLQFCVRTEMVTIYLRLLAQHSPNLILYKINEIEKKRKEFYKLIKIK